MFRSLFGFALFAVVALFLLNVFGFIVGSLIGIAFLILKLAIIGFIIYFVIKFFSPSTAARIRETFTGKPAA